ncbi:hypothetical protein CCP2SC5_30045 [Azospirillaceae bacterium]
MIAAPKKQAHSLPSTANAAGTRNNNPGISRRQIQTGPLGKRKELASQ